MDDILILCLLFWQNSFYQNCFIQIFFYSNISVEYKMDDKLGFDIDNIMKKIQFAGNRRTQVVHCCVSHTFYGLVWYVGQIQKLYRIIQPLTKYAFLVIKVLVSTSSPSNISTWILTPCQTNFNPFFIFAIFGHTHWKNCSSQPSMVHGWEALSFLVCSFGWLFVRPAMVTLVQISLLVAPHPQTHTFSESLW